MHSLRIKDVHLDKLPLGNYTFKGWIRTHRRSKNVAFMDLTDGSSVAGLQVVIDPSLESYDSNAQHFATGCAVTVEGELVESPAKGQKYEFQAKAIELLGEADAETYPLQKKGHTLEFLREHLHLRPRSNTFGAVFRVRSQMSMAIHKFFYDKGFHYIHAPMITTADGEGAGEMFQVTTFDLNNVPKNDSGVDYSEDFFKEPAKLTVTGQLEAEIFATALTNVYTFGPTFRAENSNTTRHLSEFWMIEPEMAFCELEGNMQLAEDFVRSLISHYLEHCDEELEFFLKRDWTEKGLGETLEKVVNSKFEVLEYTDAIKALENSGEKFEFPVSWGMDLQAEHEKYLTDKHVNGPVFVINYPKDIKAFYMRLNEDGKTVRAMDLLVPRLGEIIGGSQREERHDVLLQKIKDMQLPEEEYSWYLELRKYGTVPHSGFGLGFERLLMYLTGMQNIRDVIPFPRFPGFARI